MELDSLKQGIKLSIPKILTWFCLSLFLTLSNSYANDLSSHFFYGKWRFHSYKKIL